MIRVLLEDTDEQLVHEVARAWFEADRADRFTNQASGKLPTLDLVGAGCECALSRAYDVPWRPLRGTAGLRAPDVAGVDVRGVAGRGRRLLIYRKDLDDRAHVLVESRGAGEYLVVGWLWGHEAKQPRWWHEGNGQPFNVACYAVPQHVLRDTGSLPIEVNA